MTPEQEKFKTWLAERRPDELVWIKQQVQAAIDYNLPLGETVPSISKQHDGQANKYEPAFTDDDLMPFGKYINERLQDVPASYLSWLWFQGCNNLEIKNYIWNSRNALNQELSEDKQIHKYK